MALNTAPTRTPRRRTAAALFAIAMATSAPAAAHPGQNAGEHQRLAELAQVRAATAQYHNLDTAVADGYVLSSPCVPGMGYHYLRGIAGTAAELEATSPEILVYAPQPNGRLRLVAVEYATWDASATLLGQTFDPPHAGGPPFHTLHAWVWQGNPSGMFEPVNPNVNCD